MKKISVTLPEPDDTDMDGQVYFGDFEIRVDVTGGTAHPPVIVRDGVERTPAQARFLGLAFLAAAEFAEPTPDPQDEVPWGTLPVSEAALLDAAAGYPSRRKVSLPEAAVVGLNAAQEAMSNTDLLPCVCGHDAEDHAHDPSGCGEPWCQWSEGVDEYGLPEGERCAAQCREYMPDERVAAGAKALWEAHPYLMEDYSRQWFYRVAAVVLAAGDAAAE